MCLTCSIQLCNWPFIWLKSWQGQAFEDGYQIQDCNKIRGSIWTITRRAKCQKVILVWRTSCRERIKDLCKDLQGFLKFCLLYGGSKTQLCRSLCKRWPLGSHLNLGRSAFTFTNPGSCLNLQLAHLLKSSVTNTGLRGRGVCVLLPSLLWNMQIISPLGTVFLMALLPHSLWQKLEFIWANGCLLLRWKKPHTRGDSHLSILRPRQQNQASCLGCYS